MTLLKLRFLCSIDHRQQGGPFKTTFFTITRLHSYDNYNIAIHTKPAATTTDNNESTFIRAEDGLDVTTVT